MQKVRGPLISRETLKNSLLLLLVAAWPLANFVVQNGHRYFSLTELSFLYIAFSAVLFLAAFALRILSKYVRLPYERLFFILPISVFFFFSYQELGTFYITYCPGLKNVLIQFHIKFFYLWGLGLFLFSWLMIRSSKKESIRFCLRIFICVTAGTPLLQGGWTLYSAQKFHASQLIPADIPQNLQLQKKPNVYFILLDAYGRADVLKKELGFDNAPFLSALKERGFFVQENSISNYHFTLASLSATFAMHYHKQGVCGQLNQFQEFYAAWKGPHAIGNVFRNNGYTLVFADPGPWGDIGCSGYEDFGVSKKSWISSAVLQNVLMSTPLQGLKMAGQSPYMTFQDLPNLLEITPQKPKFFYIHSALVHDSMYESNGTIKKIPTLIGIGSPQSAVAYIDSIRGINKDVLAFIDKTRREDPQAIILLCSDHGPPFLEYENKNPNDPQWLMPPQTKKDFLRQFANLGAIFIPELAEKRTDYLPYFDHDTSLANVFRSLFSYLSGAPLAALPNHSYFVQYDKLKKIFYLQSSENLKEKFKKDPL